MTTASDTQAHPVLELLLKRRSVAALQLAEPGPSAEQLETILTAAARVPDHKKLAPWRFILFEGEARRVVGERLLPVLEREAKSPPDPQRLAMERTSFLRAPLVVAVVSRPVANPVVPEWEQILSAGGVLPNLCLAANALGFATNWITEWMGYSEGAKAVLGLGPQERIAGFVYIGTPKLKPVDRDRPKLADIVTRWQP